MANKQVCSTCRVEKNLSSFALYNNGKKTYQRKQCRVCYNKKMMQTPSYNDLDSKKKRIKIWAEERDGWKKKKSTHLQYKYGITFEEYEELLKEHDFKCAICGTNMDDLSMFLAVDHCHETSQIRGLLCSRCNTGLGQFRDDIELLAKAIAYLQRSKS